MTYCTKCGTANGNNEIFCRNCGASLPVAGTETLREQSMRELQEMYTYFSIKAPVYDEFDRLDRYISTNGGGVPKAGKVWGLIITISSSLLLFGAGIFEEIGMAAIALTLLAFGILLLVLNKKKRNNLKLKLEESYHQMQVLAQELAEHYYNYGPCPIGPEYTNPAQLEAIYEVILQGRADTPKEAINLLLRDAHFSKIEKLQREMAQAAWSTCAATRAQAGISAARFAYEVRRDSQI